MKKTIPVPLLMILVLTACGQSSAVPTIPNPTTMTPTLSILAPSTSTPQPPQPIPDTYAVINVFADDTLNIRSEAGVQNTLVGTLQPNQSGLIRTGKTTRVEDELWAEIQNPDGGNGWVNTEFLTEYVVPLAFCADTRVPLLLQSLETAINTLDSELMKSIVSPRHGVNVSYLRSGTVANYSPEEAGWAFQSVYVMDWGLGAGSGEPVRGTFPEIILPALQETFKNFEITCNEIILGGATYVVEWPTEYTNLNFYSVHNPGNDPSYDGLDWNTWLAGVEYVNGNPYLFSLTHYQWEP